MQLDIIRAIQRFSNPVLDVVMECFTLFGEQMILTGVFCAIYWCYNKQLGRFAGLALGASVCVNGIIKDIFKVERLFGEPGVVSRRLETATGYSFPSAHTQAATTLWGSLFAWTKRTWLRVFLVILIIMVGFSRLFLGVHYPLDVAGGVVFGALGVVLTHYIVVEKDSRVLILIFCLSTGILTLVIGESADTFKAVGILLGIFCGFFFEDAFVGFGIKTGFIPKTTRYLCGLAFVGAIYVALKLVLPHTTLWDTLRYALTVFAATGLWPYIFTRLKL